MATASLRFAPRTIGHSAGVLTVTAAAGVIRDPVKNRVDNPLIRTLVANHRRRRSERARGRFTF
ncbi:MAG: hypothetical protein A3H29_12710 [Acidobacteria bacterium RIFCSPLOWO2_02_FULL_67_21]|nr:MAG: hypothetical protein A3H29_12710 [Acidobacteria bacterium RIFCSPLOWO2_02_FULL_67_21]